MVRRAWWSVTRRGRGRLRVMVCLALGCAMAMAPVAPALANTVGPPTGQATEGASFPGMVLQALNCTGTPMIDWGDGQPQSPGECANGGSGVNTRSHTYAEEGNYAGVAHYTGLNNSQSLFAMHVADAALAPSSTSVSAVAGASFSGPVAGFNDADPGGAAGDYTALISWGDGSSSPGTVQAAAGAFSVSGTHTYAATGSYPIRVAITDAGGASATAASQAAVTAATTTTLTSTTSPAPTMSGLRSSFTMPTSIRAGQTVRLDANSSPLVKTFRWSVNGRNLADCAGATSELMTRTLPVGSDAIGLTQLSGTATLASATQNIVVQAPIGRAHVSAASGRVHLVALPPVAVCLTGPGDPPRARVAPGVAYAPALGCTTQVKSGVIEAVGCLTEHQAPIVVTFVPNQRGHLGKQHVSLPAGQTTLDGVQSVPDTVALLGNVEAALNASSIHSCVDSRGNDIFCPSGLVEQGPPSFGGGPFQGGAPSQSQGAAARAGAPTAGTARAVSGQQVAFAGPACSAAATRQAAGDTQCLDLWVATGPVRINGLDYAPAPGEEIVIAPQFNLLVSRKASTSLDGLLLNAADPFQPVDFQLPAVPVPPGGTSGIDYPALTVASLQDTIAKQPDRAAASAAIAALGSVGGFPSVGGLEISFDNDTATITFHVELPKEFGGSDGTPVTAEVVAQIGPTTPLKVVYGFLGNKSGGAGVDLGPVALDGFGLCYRDHYSSDDKIDPCKSITNIDDSLLPDHTWMASANLRIAGALDVEFRPGSNTVPGCSQAIPLGFAFSADGGLSQAGAALDLRGSGGVPIFPGISITGLAAGFTTNPQYEIFGGCVSLSALDILSITGNVFSVTTVDGHLYQFTGNELGENVLHQTGGGFPYTRHFGLGASGVASLSLPELPSFQVGAAYALYVDDPAAIFFGAGFDFGIPDGSYENAPNTGIGIRGGIAGAIGLRGGVPPPFDIEGYVDVIAQFRPLVGEFVVLNGGVQAMVTYAPPAHGGLGVCGYASILNNALTASAGIAYPWGATILDVLFNHLVFSLNSNVCAQNWLDQQIGVKVQTASVSRHAPRASIAVAQVPSGLSSVNLDVHSLSGAPDITVSGPGDVSASTAGVALGKAVRGVSFTLVRVPALHQTFVVPVHPHPGSYRITTNPGSPAVSSVVRKDGFVPSIRAHVSGHGTQRRLTYSVKRVARQLVSFFEVSGQVHRALGSTTGGHGSIAFTASVGGERRQIVAEVFGDGALRMRKTITSYVAPTLTRLGRVHRLRVTRRAGQVTLTFAPVPGGGEYRALIALSDGTRRVIRTHALQTTFSPVFGDASGTVSVSALGNGLATSTGPTVRARVPALFARVSAARRPRRPTTGAHAPPFSG